MTLLMSNITEDRFTQLEAKVAELSLKTKDVRTKPEVRDVPQRPKAQTEKPVWEITERGGGSLGTYTPGVDWEPQFFEGAQTYRQYAAPTTRGELTSVQAASSKPFMAVLRFKSPVVRQGVNCAIAGESFGRVQLKVNSANVNDIAEYVAFSAFAINIRKGDNTIILMSDGNTDRVQFRAGLF